MPYQNVAAAEQIIYSHLIENVRKFLENIKIKPETDIRIYPNYPEGWEATVGANGRIYIVKSVWGNITLDIEPVVGFSKNGALIRSKYFKKSKVLKGDIDGHEIPF